MIAAYFLAAEDGRIIERGFVQESDLPRVDRRGAELIRGSVDPHTQYYSFVTRALEPRTPLPYVTVNTSMPASVGVLISGLPLEPLYASVNGGASTPVTDGEILVTAESPGVYALEIEGARYLPLTLEVVLT